MSHTQAAARIIRLARKYLTFEQRREVAREVRKMTATEYSDNRRASANARWAQARAARSP